MLKDEKKEEMIKEILKEVVEGMMSRGPHKDTEIITKRKEEELIEEIIDEILEDMMMKNDDLRDLEEQQLDNMMKENDTEETDDVRNKECRECGKKVEEMKMNMLGLDVEALFPSMSSKRTGEIVRKRIMKSRIEPRGFNWKVGLTYIVINKHLTSSLGSMWKLLPYRRKVGGNTPEMASKGMQRKDEDVEEHWVHKVKSLSKEQTMEVVGRCAEIAVRIIFENFTYNFGGKIYLQRKGGPIGARITMACSRLVMQDWGENYKKILKESGL